MTIIVVSLVIFKHGPQHEYELEPDHEHETKPKP